MLFKRFFLQTRKLLPWILSFFAFQVFSQSVILFSGLTVIAEANPDSICQGSSTQLNTLVTGGTPPYVYHWTPESGLSDPGIANPLATPSASTWFFVSVTDNFAQTKTDSVMVTVLTPPYFPGPITGETVVCHDSVETYQVCSMPGVTSYSWTVPGDAIIVSGQNSTVITVLWGVLSGTVSVILGNDCGNSPPSALMVSVLPSLQIPGSIVGPEVGCTGIESVFMIMPVVGADTYSWSVPPDGVILSGQGTNEIVVVWGTMDGELSVFAQNACGVSPARSQALIATALPETAGDIVGRDTVCTNQAGYHYAIPAIIGAQSYHWIFPPGITITNGQYTREVIVDVGSDTIVGDIMVYGVNDCGIGNPSTKGIIALACQGVFDYPDELPFILYPNPANQVVNIWIRNNNSSIDFSLFDITGKTWYKKHVNCYCLNTIEQIDLSSFPEGIYFFQVFGEEWHRVEKLIICRRLSQ